MKSAAQIWIFILVIILISVPLSFVVTILISPVWTWLEANTGIELIGHSGPNEFSYLIVLLMLFTIFSGLMVIIKRFNRNIRKQNFNSK